MKLVRIAIAAVTVLVLCQPAHADFSGSFNMNIAQNDMFENGVRKSKDYRFNQNYYLGIQRNVTPMFSYSLFLRTSLTDTRSTSGGVRRDTYQRGIEPTLDLFLRNHVYSASAGYRRTENWTTARLTNSSRTTSDYYYFRFNLNPWEFPSFSLEADRRNEYDHRSVRVLDTTTDRYSASSYFNYNYKQLNAMYNANYTRSIYNVPLSTITKTIHDVFNGLFAVGYSGSFFGDAINMSTRYQGNYTWNRVERYVTQTGLVAFERTPFQGLSAQGTALLPSVNTLTTQSALIDNDTLTGAGGIDIATGLYYNIGLQVSSSLQAVDRLYVYVVANGDVSTDANLSSPINWRVYTSNDNNIWTQIVPINSVTITTVDALNNVYRYELVFAAQNANFYKAVNMALVNAVFVTTAVVTEVEAWGQDFVPATGIVTEKGTNYTQGWNINLFSRPSEKVDVSFSYYINQTDQNPSSIPSSMADFLENIVSKTRKIDGDLSRNVSRAYGPSVTWRPHRLLSSNVRVTRSEVFDNLGTLDASSNNYSLSFTYSPLQTLDATLSLIRSDSFTFGDRDNTTDSILLSMGARLYREVNMIVDVGHSQNEAHKTDTVTRTDFLRGSIDARITKELFTNFTYGITRTSVVTSSTSQEASMIVAYRLSRLLSVSGSFKFTDDIGGTSTSEGFSVDWLPLRVVRLNLNYQHSRQPGPKTGDSISSFVRWNIKKFLDLQVTYVYSRTKELTEIVNRTISMSLNGRF